ncbi:hypothetical protein Hanom_Chr10g00877731 [Helianthus anomalus]
MALGSNFCVYVPTANTDVSPPPSDAALYTHIHLQLSLSYLNYHHTTTTTTTPTTPTTASSPLPPTPPSLSSLSPLCPTDFFFVSQLKRSVHSPNNSHEIEDELKNN